MGYHLLILALAAPLSRPSSAWSSCLPDGDGIRPEDQQNIRINGTEMPLGIHSDPNPLVGLIMARVYKVIMEEYYGIKTTWTVGSEPGFYAAAGCKCLFCAVPDCGSPPPSTHAVLMMSTALANARNYVSSNLPERHPELLGNIGFDAQYPLNAPAAAVRDGLAALGQPLDYWGSYALPNISNVFSKFTDIPYSRVRPCNHTFSGAYGRECAYYAAYHRDFEGVEWDGKLCRAKCHHDGYWWLSPACRREPHRCVPYLTLLNGGAWFFIAARAALHDWPVAIAGPATEKDYFTLPLDYRMVWLAAAPDEAHRSVEPREILLDRYVSIFGEEKRSFLSRSFENFFYNGWAGPIEGLVAFRAKEVLRRMTYSLVQAEEMSRNFHELYRARGLPEEVPPEMLDEAACEWVRGHGAIWKAWLPLASECAVSQGMRAADGGFVEERNLAVGCEWCSLGRFSAPRWDSVGLTHACLPCPAGREQRTSGQTECTACLPGRFKALEGDMLCQDCLPGRATELPGQLSCPACAPGRAAGEPGQLSCQACPEGTSAPTSGSLACGFCERGSFAERTASRNCTSCGRVLPGSTSDRGAMGSGDCVCPADSYMLPGKGCVECGLGLECPGGNGEPLQADGFWVDVTDQGKRQRRDYTIYLCRTTQECPAGILGTCAPGRHDMACNNCKDLHFPLGDGRCQPCDSGSALPFVLFLLVVVCVISAFVIFTRVDGARQHLSLIITVVIAGQILTTLQALSAMKQIQIPWPEQLRRLLDILSLVTFDLELLALPCILTSDNPVSKFALKLLAYPAFLALLGAIFLLSRLLGRPLEKVALINANGTFLLAIYISLTLAVALPFQCQGNPSGFLSMATQPGVRCFEDPAHVSLSVLAALGILLYPVGVASYVAYGTLRCRAMVGTVAGVQFARKFQFIFARYRPECYAFGLVFLLRNCLVALVPVLFVTMPVLQVNAIALVLLAGLVLQVWFQPWRTALPNRTDTVLGMILVMVVTGVAALMDNTTDGVSTVIAIAMTATVVLCLVGMLLVLLFAVYRHFFPRKLYGIFLCHHKAAAGNLCRLLKLLLAPKTSRQVFIDSDHLDDLDQLFETVRCNVENLVVVLTQKVLARPWCAGEIVTAHRNGLSMVPLACDDFEPLDIDQVRCLVQAWSEQELALLGQFGIRPEMVHEAFACLLAKEPLRMQRMLPLPRKEVVMGELIARCQLPLSSGMAVLRAPSLVQRRLSGESEADAIVSTSSAAQNAFSGARVLVTGLVSDSESLAACEIMQLELQRELETGVTVIRDQHQLSEALPTADILLVLWSRGVLQDPTFARLLLSVSEAERPPQLFTALADPAFQFPGADFLEHVERKGLAGLDPSNGPALAAMYRNLLKILSRPFDPQRSQAAITEQVKELASRARKRLGTRQQPASPVRSTWSQRTGSVEPIGQRRVSFEEGLPAELPELPPSKEGRDWL